MSKLYTALHYLPLGSIEPLGWLERQLRLQADNITGPIEDHWEDLGSNSGWRGGNGESWERGPYYLDGLIPLAWSLKDELLMEKARQWVKWILGSQLDDGFFGPPETLDWWPRMVVVKAIILYFEASHDPRVPFFLERYFRYQRSLMKRKPLDQWGMIRGGDEILSLHWMYEYSGEEWYLELADEIYGQTADWKAFLELFPYKRPMADILEESLGQRDPTLFEVEDIAGKIAFYHHTHGVNMAMGLKTSMLRYCQTGDPEFKEAVETGFHRLHHYHGVANGLFTGDEHLAGNHPEQGVETCTVVEYLFSMEELFRMTGDSRWADALERGAYNALPAAMTSDLSCHQYFQHVNQSHCTVGERNWYNGKPDSLIFGLEPNFGCCTANLHQGWPKFTRSLWMTDGTGSVTAVSYAPCRVQATLDDILEFHVLGDYPFDSKVRIEIRKAGGQELTFNLRIPHWCDNPLAWINGSDVSENRREGQFSLTRNWDKGDVIELNLPMHPSIKKWPNGSRSVELGPLTLSLGGKEKWHRIGGTRAYPDWEVRGEGEEAFGCPDLNHIVFGEIETNAVGEEPFSFKDPPLVLPMTARDTVFRFVPYGNARIRKTQFYSKKRGEQ